MPSQGQERPQAGSLRAASWRLLPHTNRVFLGLSALNFTALKAALEFPSIRHSLASFFGSTAERKVGCSFNTLSVASFPASSISNTRTTSLKCLLILSITWLMSAQAALAPWGRDTTAGRLFWY